MTTISEGEKDLPDEDRRVEDGIVCEGQNASVDVELKVESVSEDVNDEGRRALQAQGALQVQQQQSQSGTICWERFLHVTSIKVLLVESDDSTRHIVTALLRNCNYEVIEAANGLQAWRVLEDLTNHIDLVLTELEMPCVSGIVLLCKIMSHKTRKNVPVIMMSSRDSMGLVFKCLSKGAVDFLVKPIRKNELKNLWQHVWRRCHSSSGSGSESGTQTQNSVKSKSIEKCGNNSGSSDGEDNGSDGLNIGDGSDDGSGAQSSWTKQAAEVDSSQAASPWDQVTECPDSTCAQVIRSNAENSGNRKVHVAATKDCQEEKQPDNTKCKYPAMTIPKKLETQCENPIGAPINSVGEKHTNMVEIDPSASNNRIEKEQIDRKEFEAQKMVAAVSEIENNTIHESRKAVIEPSLKRLREMKESRETSEDDRCVFRRSEQSAFTRYNTSSQSNPLRTPNGLTGNSLVIDSGLESANNVVSNNIDMGSTTNKLATKPLTVQDKSEATCTTNGLHPSSAYKPVKNDFRNCQSLIKTSDMQATTLLAPSSSHTDIPDQHLHHHNNHYPRNSHHLHNQEQQPASNHDKFSLKQLTANALNSDSSNVMAGPFEGTLGNHSLNKSASGSNHGSNGQNGSSTAVNVGGNNGKTETGLDNHIHILCSRFFKAYSKLEKMIPGRNAVRSRVLALCCFLVLMRFAESRVARREVDVLQQIVTTMGVTTWKFNASSCNIEGVGTAQPPPSWSESNVECDCNVGNSTVCHIVKIVLKGLSLPGVLPPKLVELPYIQHIDFAYNYLSGTIPTEWASTKLNFISVLVNRLSGKIPKALGNITSLTYLNLEGNQFLGAIPSELGNLVNLETLMLSSNSLVGRLPASFSALVNLTDFRINDNNFTGPIPDFIGNWKQLIRLEMQASGLEGPIPANISLLNNLINLRISDINGPSQGFPVLSSNGGLVTLILRNCNISGKIPPYIWNLAILETLDVSFNKLEGGFPDHISPRSTLQFLFLTGNLLRGYIPSSILVTGLNVDLSYNNFTWQGLDGPACQPNLNLNINMYKSFSTVSALRRVLPCAEEVTCPRYVCSLNVNCGGNDVTVKERNREVLYEGDASVEGSSASRYFTSGNYWGFSSTGDFMDDANIQNARFIVSQPSPNLSELYRSARISPLSLTYFQYCLENGTYNVSLHFAEIEFRNDSTYYSLGRRIFDIYIQEKLVRKDFNIEEEARGAQRPAVLYFNASVTDNTLEIRVYWAGKGTTRIPLSGHYGPLVSAISVQPYFKCSNGTNNHANIYIIVGVVAACSIIVMLGLLWWNGCLPCRGGHRKELAGGELQMVTYTLKQIKVATRNFDIANKVGEGGFGPVYKGRLPDGTLIAVKQLSSKSRQGNKEFLNEIGMFSCLQHPNVVKLLGGCIEADQLLLVYEYMENNSLANALFKDNQLVLDWPTRLKICIGVARGLTFLHEESSLKIVHRDVKATNVLLDRDMNPKISDFGLARLNEDDKTHMSTRIAGTVGYMAPEYALWGHLTYKADVYSFGIVLLEIVSGQSNSNYMPIESCVCLLDWACLSLLSGNLEQFTDQKLNSHFNKEEVEGVVKVALLCTSATPTQRPIMSEVLGMLEGRISIPAEIPEASTCTDDLRFKAIKDYRREKTKFSNAATGTNSQISGTDYFEYNPESPSRRNQSEIRVLPENPATF